MRDAEIPYALLSGSYKNCREMPDFFKLQIITSSWSWLNGLLESRSVGHSKGKYLKGRECCC